MAKGILSIYHTFAALWNIAYVLFVLKAIFYILTQRPEIAWGYNVQPVLFISFWASTYYFIARFSTDGKHDRRKELFFSGLFNYIILPLTVVTSINFWGLYITDQKLIDRYGIIPDLGTAVNHMTHTSTLLLAFLEVLLNDTPRRNVFPSLALWAMFGICTFYYALARLLEVITGEWPYPFMGYIKSNSYDGAYIFGNSIIGYIAVWASYAIKEYFLNNKVNQQRFIKKIHVASKNY